MTQVQKAVLKKAQALKLLGKSSNSKELANKLQRTLQSCTSK